MKFTWDNTDTTDAHKDYKTTSTPAPTKPVEVTPKYTEPITPNYQQGWICPKCGRVNAPWVSSCPCYNNFNVINNFESTACKNCSNHPSNGGSGICHCTLGGFKITY